eukprot:SAG22_NODE_1602_length_4021_cov_10.186130_3_plen_80_part_00
MIVLLGVSMMIGTCCGMLRTVALQLLLVPYRDYGTCGKFCGWACAPPEMAMNAGRSASDSKPDFLSGTDETTSNPVASD